MLMHHILKDSEVKKIQLCKIRSHSIWFPFQKIQWAIKFCFCYVFSRNVSQRQRPTLQMKLAGDIAHIAQTTINNENIWLLQRIPVVRS